GLLELRHERRAILLRLGTGPIEFCLEGVLADLRLFAHEGETLLLEFHDAVAGLALLGDPRIVLDLDPFHVPLVLGLALLLATVVLGTLGLPLLVAAGTLMGFTLFGGSLLLLEEVGDDRLRLALAVALLLH